MAVKELKKKVDKLRKLQLGNIEEEKNQLEKEKEEALIAEKTQKLTDLILEKLEEHFKAGGTQPLEFSFSKYKNSEEQDSIYVASIKHCLDLLKSAGLSMKQKESDTYLFSTIELNEEQELEETTTISVETNVEPDKQLDMNYTDNYYNVKQAFYQPERNFTRAESLQKLLRDHFEKTNDPFVIPRILFANCDIKVLKELEEALYNYYLGKEEDDDIGDIYVFNSQEDYKTSNTYAHHLQDLLAGHKMPNAKLPQRYENIYPLYEKIRDEIQKVIKQGSKELKVPLFEESTKTIVFCIEEASKHLGLKCNFNESKTHVKFSIST